MSLAVSWKGFGNDTGESETLLGTEKFEGVRTVPLKSFFGNKDDSQVKNSRI